jgi:hypothetical protein
MRRIVLFLCVFTILHAIKTEDRIRLHAEKHEASRQIAEYTIPRPQSTRHRDTIALIDENFENGMPTDWTVIDGNNDGYMWTTGTTFDLYGVQPLNYGTAYVYYSDDDAGVGAPAGTEYLISPAVRCAGAESLSLSYSWGFNAVENPFGATYVRFHDDSTWTNWNLTAFYIFLGNGDTIIDLSSYLPAESIQIQYTYEDLDGVKGGAFGIDNVLLEAYIITEYVWNFESGWQDWTHTNGNPFPGGWDVEPSNLHSSHTPPNAGDSTIWVDSDAAGSGFGLIADTAKSPIVVPPIGMAKYKWGYCNNGGSGGELNDLYVGINHFTTGVWTSVQLAHYPNGVVSGPAWDSIDVSSYAVADSIQAWFYFSDQGTWGYWACFDNVGLYALPEHDVGCFAVVSPPEGRVDPDVYDVVGLIRNVGTNVETFDIVANVYDTHTSALVFSQTINLTLTAGGDTNVDFGQITFDPEKYYSTKIFTLLPLDMNSTNDTSTALSWSTISGSVMFEMDIEAICNDNQLLGIEFDGQRFYITGGNNASDPNKVYVVDTSGYLLWTMDQASHSTGWGWRDLTWDRTYLGPDRIDTLYASVDPNVDKFSINLYNGTLIYHGSFPGHQSPNRALACKPDSGWFYTANFSSNCYKFNKSGILIQSVPNTYAMYGAAYDAGNAMWPWQTPIESVWWHSQDDPGTGFACQISRMDPHTMDFINPPFGFTLPAALTSAVAGGLCFDPYAFSRLFALLQGTPHDYIVGIYVTSYGVNEEHNAETPAVFGFAPIMTTVTRGRMNIDYTTQKACVVSLGIYDITGRRVRTLVHGFEEAGLKQTNWDGKDALGRMLPSGVYFLQLQAGDYSAAEKIILLR